MDSAVRATNFKGVVAITNKVSHIAKKTQRPHPCRRYIIHILAIAPKKSLKTRRASMKVEIYFLPFLFLRHLLFSTQRAGNRPLPSRSEQAGNYLELLD